ncbi:type II CAAX endopeptidase family protein [Winogradskya consettensis]|uniref:CAAX amino protease n=1 Tax=Winogradskya consettensis TaxID=113560 RepID=A0A919VNB2_9ACTN|nr:type II CAAX endopeptidase family protein [Actinoplanes consettensis]GIM72564.1 CAAX amino protease [Actinoplanes consettensis]
MTHAAEPRNTIDPTGTPTGSVWQQRMRTFRAPILIVGMALVLVVARAFDGLSNMSAFLGLPIGIASAVGAVFFYRWLNRTVEGRTEVEEVTKVDRWKNLRRGVTVGAVAFTITMLIIGMFGGWEHIGGGSIGGFLITLGIMSSVAVNEEMLFRGVIFRIMEERLGTVVALVISSVLFGLTHLVNHGATVWGTVAIAIEGGTMMVAAYVLTRSLWLPIGIHFAWNLTEAGIFGVPTSGTTPTATLWHTTLDGNSALTGGTFGPEASLTALLVCAIPTVFMLRRAARNGQFRKGQLRRNKAI